MKIKITGFYNNGHKYEGVTPKESLTESEANILLSIWEPQNLFVFDSELKEYVTISNTSTSNSSPLNLGTLEAVLFDDEIIQPAERTRLLIAFKRMGVLPAIRDFVHVLNGENEIWFDEVRMFDYYDPRLQAAENEIKVILPTFSLKEAFSIANSIE